MRNKYHNNFKLPISDFTSAVQFFLFLFTTLIHTGAVNFVRPGHFLCGPTVAFNFLQVLNAELYVSLVLNTCICLLVDTEKIKLILLKNMLLKYSCILATVSILFRFSFINITHSRQKNMIDLTNFTVC